MSYSGNISKLNSCLSSISNIKLDTSFDWEGSAKNKQVSILKSLEDELSNEKGSVKTLISALEAIDSYDESKKERNKYIDLLSRLDSNADGYLTAKSSYESSRDAAARDMEKYKKDAETALGSITSSYSSSLSNIAVTKAKDTTVDLLPDGLFSDATSSIDVPDSSKKISDLSTTQNTTGTTQTTSGPSYNYSGVSSYPSSNSSSATPYVSDSAVANYVVDKIDMSNVPDAPTETICAANTDLNVKSSRKDITSCFSKETQEIVSKHANDFNYSNFRDYIKNDEDFEKYCKEVLGGVFAKWTGKNKKGKGETASEFQEIAEYTFGLMVMYGFDYCNGDPDHYGKYGANNGDVASNAFYPSGVYNSSGKNNNTNGSNIDKICAGTTEDDINMTTNCNYGMDYLYHKAGILGVDGAPSSSCATGSLARYAKSKGGGMITNASELKVGTLIECYRKEVPTSAATVENAGNLGDDYSWYHVCCVGEVEKNAAGETVAVVLYDAGHRFTNGGNFKYRVEIKNNNLRDLGDYGSKWVGIDLNLTQDSYTTVK